MNIACCDSYWALGDFDADDDDAQVLCVREQMAAVFESRHYYDDLNVESSEELGSEAFSIIKGEAVPVHVHA